MYRNSLKQPATATLNQEEIEDAGDEYYEFDGAKLEIKHNAKISQSTVSIGTGLKITTNEQSSILEGSDSLHSPPAADTGYNFNSISSCSGTNMMAEGNNNNSNNNSDNAPGE